MLFIYIHWEEAYQFVFQRKKCLNKRQRLMYALFRNLNAVHKLLIIIHIS